MLLLAQALAVELVGLMPPKPAWITNKERVEPRLNLVWQKIK